ncbi:SGNH hydrolase-type esterase domain-containing protein [Neurospora tetraspora]|uniref:SGNH hydrolase-type esterase domain-containing protein n=1 Tax=Neurospora tetraspora TaxID=94610 RepID=A0AAE0J8S0_9PEZI|nr:SGNH hydrolase-type esterase domain-containing protein [Neurospora tetraspora]
MVATIRLLSGLVGSLSLLSQASAEPLRPTEQVRIMALGDSITGNPGCWRALLSRKLNATNIVPAIPYSQIRFVGTQNRTKCGYGRAYDWMHEGHGGMQATELAQATDPVTGIPVGPPMTQPRLRTYLTSPGVDPVDIILMHLGTNDIWNKKTTAEIISAYGQLLDQMRAVNPDVRLLVAQILPMEPSNCPDCAAKVRQLNRYIPLWAQYVNNRIQPGESPVRVVDQYTGFNATRFTTDGVHPNARGDEAIAQKWLDPVVAAVREVIDQRPGQLMV